MTDLDKAFAELSDLASERWALELRYLEAEKKMAADFCPIKVGQNYERDGKRITVESIKIHPSPHIPNGYMWELRGTLQRKDGQLVANCSKHTFYLSHPVAPEAASND